jgi:hypothetical protein
MSLFWRHPEGPLGSKLGAQGGPIVGYGCCFIRTH